MLLTQVQEAETGAAAAAGIDSYDRSRLLELLRALDAEQYRFVTATPGTHTRVLSRPDRQDARSLRDVLGWSLPFRPEVVPGRILSLLEAAGCIAERPDGRLNATVRVSSVLDTLFLHSAFPTLSPNSVFLGPDSYRFADYILASAGTLPANARILDYGAGAGVGGISAARFQRGSHLTLADINPKALFLASINAEFARLHHDTVEARTPADVPGEFDLIVTHPPFMMDPDKRAYRDGGDLYGGQLSLAWTLAAIPKLNPGGKLILHTGISIVDGRDLFIEQLRAQVDAARYRIAYRELDPDIFSEDLDEPAYQEVERIAAVGLCITRAAGQTN